MRATFFVGVVFVLAGVVAAQPQGKLFENVVEVLEDNYYDRDYRRRELPELAARFRQSARDAESLDEERAVVHSFLSHIPASHLALYSRATWRVLMGALSNQRIPTLGFQLRQRRGKFFVTGVLEGGPADFAGVCSGDRVLQIDGVDVALSSRLDWRSDDAHLPDPPVHVVLCGSGDVVRVECEIAPGRVHTFEVEASSYTALDAAKASVRVVRHKGKKFGYVHLWYMHFSGTSGVVKNAIRRRFADCDGLVLDIRGRGGSPQAVDATVAVLKRYWKRPLAVLIDRGTRSAKELLADEIRDGQLGVLVGEKTAGAVIPASFVEVGFNSVLMFPKVDMHSALEGHGVEPDVEVASGGPFSGGEDPILDVGLEVLDRATRS